VYRVSKPSYSTLELCDKAATMVKDAGFVLFEASRGSEVCYYRWPDRPQLLRISCHSRKKMPIGIRNDVVAKITFSGNCGDTPGRMRLANGKFEGMVAQAIGRYFLKSKERGVIYHGERNI